MNVKDLENDNSAASIMMMIESIKGRGTDAEWTMLGEIKAKITAKNGLTPQERNRLEKIFLPVKREAARRRLGEINKRVNCTINFETLAKLAQLEAELRRDPDVAAIWPGKL